MEILLRPVQETDLPRILAIEKLSFSDPWSNRSFLSELVFLGFNYSVGAIDIIQDQLIGYCFYWLIEDDEIHINNIAVDPTVRKQGIGKMLIHHIAEQGRQRGIPSITLEVRAANETAQKFYERLGFQLAGRRKNYYAHPKDDALILRWLL